jgi:hypothetical protein
MLDCFTSPATKHLPPFTLGSKGVIERTTRGGGVAESQYAHVSAGSDSFDGLPDSGRLPGTSSSTITTLP